MFVGPLWQNAVNRFPILKGCQEPQLVNSPDNFTPDGRWILGEAPEVKNYFVACGMNGNSLQVIRALFWRLSRIKCLFC